MRKLFAALSALLLVPSPARAGTVHALFVGIDKYQYSRTNVPSADFGDLAGAVGDVGRIKAAFATAYGLKLDRPANGQCSSKNATSITLTNLCATRAAILGSLQAQIDAAKAGDTVLFYYAGHGSQIADDQKFDQASGDNDTILPADARKPGAESDNDILDREMKGFIDEANAKGVNVVTIYDSCDSGTGTRAGPFDDDPGEDRAAPILVVKSIQRPPPPLMRGPGGGYRVHLAASADGSVAREVALSADGGRAGVFTSALAKTLVAMPGATFADIMAEVSLLVAEGGRAGQVPQIEGEVNATFGGKRAAAPLFDAASAADGVALAAGELSGVTTGSTYALFARASDALATTATPLAIATVGTVGPTSAQLRLDGAPAKPLPGRLVARERNHAFGTTTLAVRIGARDEPDLTRVQQALAKLPFVKISDQATLAIDVMLDEDSTTYLGTVGGSPIANLGPVSAANFADRTEAALRKVLRAQGLLALRTAAGASEALPGFCIANDLDYDARRCPQPGPGKPFSLAPGAQAKVGVVNRAEGPRYLYVYAIDETYEVNLLIPSGSGKDPPLAPNFSVSALVKPDGPGRYWFVTIASDTPIASAQALEQTGARDPGACRTALERLVCEAASGSRDPTVPRVGAWTATVTEVVVRRGGPTP